MVNSLKAAWFPMEQAVLIVGLNNTQFRAMVCFLTGYTSAMA